MSKVDDDGRPAAAVRLARLQLLLRHVQQELADWPPLATMALPREQWLTLTVLARQALTVQALARELGQKRSAVAERVEALRADGLLQALAAGEEPARGLLRLTEAGRAALRQAEGRLEDHLAGWPSVEQSLGAAEAGLHELLRRLRDPAEPVSQYRDGVPKTGRRYLFICGVGRSGTTLSARLLDAHPDVVMGVERFKFLYNTPQLSASLFEAQRFLDVREGDTNIVRDFADPSFDATRAKLPRAAYVGDKVPHLYQYYARIHRVCFGRAAFLFCYRNLFEVAQSWDKRANDPNDRWPKEHDWRTAGEHWNEAFRATLAAHRDGLLILPINYALLSSSEQGIARDHLTRLLRRLDLDWTPEMEAALAAEFRRAATLRQQREPLPEDARAAIEASVDPQPACDFLDAFGLDAEGMPAFVQRAWAARQAARSANVGQGIIASSPAPDGPQHAHHDQRSGSR